MWHLNLLVFGFLSLSLSSAMVVKVDQVVNPESNSTFRYWERVWTSNDTKASNSSALVETNLKVKSATNSSSDSFSVYFVIYNNNRPEGLPRCCSAERASKGKCTAGALLDEKAYLYLRKLTFGPHTEHPVTPSVEIDAPGTYTVEITNCEPMHELRAEGTITWKSTHGYLFPEEYPLILISEVLAGIYFLVFTIFGALAVYYRSSLFKIHYAIAVTLALYVSKECLWAFYYDRMNRTGEFSFQFLAFVVLAHIIAQMARLILMLSLAIGLGTSVSLVKTARVVDYDVINLGGFGSEDEEDSREEVDPYKASAPGPCGWLCGNKPPAPPSCDRLLILRVVLFCILNFIFQYVDAFQSAAASYTEEDVIGKAWSLSVNVGVITLTLIFYLWVVFSLINTFRFLKGHPNQLRDYKLFLIVGVTAMLLGVGIMGYSVYSRVLQGAPATSIKEWSAVWENRLVWDIVTCFLLLSIAFIWNPYRSSAFNRATHVA